LGQDWRENRQDSQGILYSAYRQGACCSNLLLARHGQPLNRVEQGQDGCLLNAAISYDIWSFAGDFLVTVQRQDQGSSVEAATVIKAQLYDWGKSKRILTNLFNDIRALPI
jgi:hypothetical protein